MKVLFLEIDMDRTWAAASIGPACLGAFIRQQGHEASLMRIPPDQSFSDIILNIEDEAPDMLALSLTSRQWLRAREVVRKVRVHLDIPVIAGGLHPTFAPEAVLASEGFDYVCLGEGEEALLEVLAFLEKGKSIVPGQIDNIGVPGASRPNLRSPFEPLDALPFMARDLLDEQNGVHHMCTQRGCPFPCTYCAARNFNDLYKGSDYGRRRSHENVVKELFEIQRNGTLNYVIFLDDTFTIDNHWVMEFCRVYGRDVGVGFSLHARVETVSLDMLTALAEAGCKHIVYGIESGSYRVRRDIMKRPVKNERFLEVFRWTKDLGILVTANYMLGLPGETVDDIRQTLELNEQLQPNDFGHFVYYPYPGTHLFETCREKGYLPDNYLELPAINRQSILNLPDLTHEEIAYFYDQFTVARERNHMKQYGKTYDRDQQKYVSEKIKESAALM